MPTCLVSKCFAQRLLVQTKSVIRNQDCKTTSKKLSLTLKNMMYVCRMKYIFLLRCIHHIFAINILILFIALVPHTLDSTSTLELSSSKPPKEWKICSGYDRNSRTGSTSPDYASQYIRILKGGDRNGRSSDNSATRIPQYL